MLQDTLLIYKLKGEGLRLFAELSGRYPKKLSVMELAQETMAFITNRNVIEKIKEKMAWFKKA